MKRIVFIACLLLSCLAMHGVVTTSHVFNSTDPANKIVSFAGSYKQATMTDGTLYTCSEGASFASGPGGVCISLPSSGIVVVSPARQGLRSFTIRHTSNTVTMDIWVSTDGSTWTPATDLGTRNNTNGAIEITGLNGNYFVKFRNTTGPAFYVTEMDYQTEQEPESCRCLRVVVN